jgi:hypothetical protein
MLAMVFASSATILATVLTGNGSQILPNLPQGPPDARGNDEVSATANSDAVAATCADYGRRLADGTVSKLIRVSVTVSKRWGTVWRADISSKDRPPIVSRIICSKGLVNVRPLKMFDPSQNIPPLP